MRWRLPLFALIVLVTRAFGSAEAKIPTERPYMPPKRWALVVGAGNYSHLGKLNYAVDDAKAFAKTLTDRYSFRSDSVELITDDPDSPLKPDGATIKAALKRQIADKRLDKGDLFVFFFAGHGEGTSQGDFILPTDATKENAAQVGQPIREIVNMFVDAGLKNVLVIVDACRSGEETNNFGAELQQLGQKANIAVMLGCAPGSRSYEYAQLGHGVFTHFLLKGLANRQLCSPETGSLWVSRIADDVQKQVRDYTVRDYPTKPQTPERWTDPTRDVLMGAFPSQSRDVGKFLKEAEKLDQDKYAASLDQYAADLFNANRHAEATEIYKTLESLNKLSNASRYVFGWSLQEQGRYEESSREFNVLAKQDEDPFYKNISALFNPSRSVTPQQRIKAAHAAWKLEPVRWVGIAVAMCLQVYSSNHDTQVFLDEFLKTGDLDERTRRFMEGVRAMDVGDWRGALAKYDEVIKLPGDDPTKYVVDSMRYVALTYLGEIDKLVAELKQWTGDPEYGAKWALLLADYYDEVGKADEKMRAVKQALALNVEPEDLLHALRLSAMRYPEIADQVLKRATEFPYSWKAKVATVWVEASKNGKQAIDKAIADSIHLCDDEFSVLYEIFRILDKQFDEMLDKSLMSKEMYSQFQLSYSAIMAAGSDKFGYDPDVWLLFTKFCLGAEKYEQLLTLYERKLGALLDDGTLDPKLRAHFLFVAFAMGADRRIEQVWKLGGFHPADIIDGGWVRAMYLGLQGKLKEARAAIPSSKPSSGYRSTADAFLAYLSVMEGQKVDLHALAAKMKDNASAMQFIALAYVKLGKWDVAEPLIKEFSPQRQMSLTFIQAKSMEVYQQRLLATKHYAEADELAYTVMTAAFGNPLFAKIHFGSKVDVSQFAGQASFEAISFALPTEVQKGSFKLQIAADGSATFSGAISGHEMAGRGKVDAYGNLRIPVKIGSIEVQLAGKIAPVSLYKTFPKFAEVGQIFTMIDGEGQLQYLFGRPAKG